jgi:hypothetical protein
LAGLKETSSASDVVEAPVDAPAEAFKLHTKEFDCNGEYLLKPRDGTRAVLSLSTDIANAQYSLKARRPLQSRMDRSFHPSINPTLPKLQKLFDEAADIMAEDNDICINDNDSSVVFGTGDNYLTDDRSFYVEFNITNSRRPQFPNRWDYNCESCGKSGWHDFTIPDYNIIDDKQRAHELLRHGTFSIIKQFKCFRGELSNHGACATLGILTILLPTTATKYMAAHEWCHTHNLDHRGGDNINNLNISSGNEDDDKKAIMYKAAFKVPASHWTVRAINGPPSDDKTFTIYRYISNPEINRNEISIINAWHQH